MRTGITSGRTAALHAKRDVWVISYGPEVPGMGRVDELRVSFKDGKVSKLEQKVYLRP